MRISKSPQYALFPGVKFHTKRSTTKISINSSCIKFHRFSYAIINHQLARNPLKPFKK